jgi:pimeloyl-ACP methyl ester carboxylesterase
MTETPFEVSTPAGTIAGWESGEGPALLFLHGGPGLNEYGRMLAGEVAGWRFISFQQRGLSPSTTGGPLTLDQHVTDSVAVLDACGADQAVVVGHSWGGHLALHLAVSHPDRVAGLVLVDGLGVVGDGGASELGQALAARLLPAAAQQLQQLQQIAEELGEDEPADEIAAEQLRLLWPGYFADPAGAPPPGELRVSTEANRAALASVTEHLAAGFADSLSAVRMPVLCVLGAQSPMPVSQGEQTAALIPLAEVRVIPAGGHVPWFEQPGCVADALASVRLRSGATDSRAT